MHLLRFSGSVAYLVVLATASVFLADASWKSITGYRSGYALDRIFDAGPALAERVLLVVFDGLRLDRSAQLPAFGGLATRGGSGILQVPVPSLSNPARAAMVTGALPEVSGVTNNAEFAPPPVQSIFGLAAGHGIESAVYGARFWPRAFPDQITSFRQPSIRPTTYDPNDLIAWQMQICNEALDFLTSSGAGIQVVGLLAGDEAGHSHGGESRAYREVTAAVDNCLGRITAAAGPESTVVAVSDHGQIHRWGKGGHGGGEPEVVKAPFAMAGPGIRKSGPVHGQLADVAPTLSVLLGLPIPANSQGKVMWDLLDVPIGQDRPLRDLERIQREALSQHMPNREDAVARLRQGRIPLGVAALVWFLGLSTACIYHQRIAPLAIAMVVFVGVYYSLFYLFQLGYSLSAIVREEFLYSFFARNIAAAAIGLIAASVCLGRLGCPDAGAVMRLAMLVTSGFGLMATAVYYQFGLQMEGWMIEIGPGFKAYMDLLAILGVVLGTMLALAAGRIRSGTKEDPT